MWFAVLLAVMVGVSIVVQSGVNADLMKGTSLWLLLAVGNLLVAFIAFAVFFLGRSRSEAFDEIARLPAMVLVPGFCGLVIIAGMPMAMQKLGVFNAVLLVIACQILAGIAWDRFVVGQDVGLAQLAGAVLVFAGVLLVLRPGS